jgi:hypothetical protein
MTIRLPDDTQRVSVIGRTGSGKTQGAVWQLSKRRFDIRPWIIFDWKRDKLIGSLGATSTTINKVPPKKPGLYIVQPKPHEAEDGTLEDYMWKIWSQENIGVYIDEGYMIGNNNAAFRAMLTQGRSKHIPMITLSQRPVGMDRYVFSESDYFQIFEMTDVRDKKTVNSFVPVDLDERVPKFHSIWYDVGQNEATLLAPVPEGAKLQARFRQRIGRKRKAL